MNKINKILSVLFAVGALDDFGEQFASKVARKFYQNALVYGITNQMYEGDIKKAGDRLNILQFLHDIPLEDYVAGTDMSVQALFDTESQLIVEKRKSYNFAIDRLEDVFTYVTDMPDVLVENASRTIERGVDSYVLEKYADASVNNWIGISLRVVGSSADTDASIATSATGGTLTIATATGVTSGEGMNTVENPRTGNTFSAGFYAADVGRPVRLTSGATWATAWYKIDSVTNTGSVAIVNFDGSTAGPHIPNGDILEGLAGASGGWLRYRDPQNGDGKPTTEAGWGWELGAAEATSVASGNVYEVLTLLAEALDQGEIPAEDRHVVLPPEGMAVLKQAAELQPSGVESVFRDTVINGRVMRVGGFDIHAAAGGRVSLRAEHAGGSGEGDAHTTTAGAQRYCIPAWHRSFCTFAYKWAESRIVDAENQFAKKYQGLHLYGAAVPPVRRKGGAMVLATFDKN